jgi:hypothetical protein
MFTPDAPGSAQTCITTKLLTHSQIADSFISGLKPMPSPSPSSGHGPIQASLSRISSHRHRLALLSSLFLPFRSFPLSYMPFLPLPSSDPCFKIGLVIFQLVNCDVVDYSIMSNPPFSSSNNPPFLLTPFSCSNDTACITNLGRSTSRLRVRSRPNILCRALCLGHRRAKKKIVRVYCFLTIIVLLVRSVDAIVVIVSAMASLRRPPSICFQPRLHDVFTFIDSIATMDFISSPLRYLPSQLSTWFDLRYRSVCIRGSPLSFSSIVKFPHFITLVAVRTDNCLSLVLIEDTRFFVFRVLHHSSPSRLTFISLNLFLSHWYLQCIVRIDWVD